MVCDQPVLPAKQSLITKYTLFRALNAGLLTGQAGKGGNFSRKCKVRLYLIARAKEGYSKRPGRARLNGMLKIARRRPAGSFMSEIVLY